MILETRQLTLQMVDLMSKHQLLRSADEAKYAYNHEGKNICAETLQHFEFLFKDPVKMFFWLEEGPCGSCRL